MFNKIALTLLIVLAVVCVFKPTSTNTVVEKVKEGLGGVASPEFSIGAVRLTSAGTASLTQATNTVICSLQSPSSTSTLVTGAIRLDTATATLTSLSVSKSTTNATVGTLISSTTIASGVFANKVFASTTASSATEVAQAITDRVFSPNTYLNVAQQGGGILNQSGYCSALWQVE